jgi:DNA-binding IclR family transcriptional regulator
LGRSLRVTELGLSALSGTPLAVQARPYLEELSRWTSYTAPAAVLDGPEILVVECVRAARRAQRGTAGVFAAGTRFPAHRCAMGKVLLADPPAEEAKAVMAELDFSRRSPNGAGGRRALARELREVREDGVARGEEELAAGVVEIAAAVRGESGETAAAAGIATLASMVGVDGLKDHLAPHLAAAARSRPGPWLVSQRLRRELGVDLLGSHKESG